MMISDQEQEGGREGGEEHHQDLCQDRDAGQVGQVQPAGEEVSHQDAEEPAHNCHDAHLILSGITGQNTEKGPSRLNHGLGLLKSKPLLNLLPRTLPS